MDQRTRYRLMRESGVTTVFLAKKYGKHARSIRRAIEGSVVHARWAEDCRRYIADRMEVTYDQFWQTPNAG